MMPRFGLSKSKLISGLQCPKRLYLEVHQPELAQWDESAEQRFEIGHEVGAVARTLFPGGRLIEALDDLPAALRLTREALSEQANTRLFEAAFEHGGVLVRSDIVERHGPTLRAVEVKSSTWVKDYQLTDAAIQYWVMTGAGHSLSSISIAHIDNTFVYQGDGDYRGLFKFVDVTGEVTPLIEKVPAWIAEFRRMLGREMPAIEMGRHCKEPFTCPFQDYCGRDLPEYPLSILRYGRPVAERLAAEGYKDLRDVPEGKLRNETHIRIWRVTKSGEAEIGDEGREVIRAFPYPRYYLDFETVQFAVPIWAGTRPYEQLPFQWSCHVERAGGDLEHHQFLDTSGAAPMRALAEALIATLGEQGPILMYTHFERDVLNALAGRFPDLEAAITRIVARLVDLYPIAQAYYYHPDMKGSWSLKSVLPTIAPELDYENLGKVQDGGGAQLAYLEIIDPVTHADRRARLTADLKAYCGQDTMALVKLAHCFDGK